MQIKCYVLLLKVLVFSVFSIGYAQHQVSWKNVSSLNIQQQEIKKASGWSWNNGGALSRNKLRANTDGKMTYVIKGTETLMMVGLSEYNSDAHPNSIQHAMYYSYGTLKIWESGHNRGSFGGLTVGDTLIVSRINDSIKYERHNIDGTNLELRTVATDASKELYVDLSIYYPNLAVNHVYCDFDEELTIWDNTLYYHNIGTGRLGSINVSVTGHPPYNFSWSNGETTEDLSGLIAGEYTLTVTDSRQDTAIKTYRINEEETHSVGWQNLTRMVEDTIAGKLRNLWGAGWGAGALSTNKLPANINGRFKYVYEHSIARYFIMGFSEYNENAHYSNIQHSIYINDKRVLGTSITPIENGDTLIVERIDSTILYRIHRIDGTQELIRQEPTIPSKELYIDVSGLNSGQALLLNNLTCSFDNGVSIERNKIIYQNTTNNTLGSIDVNVTGVEPLNYSWSNGATTQNVSNLTAGIYTLTVVDATGETKTKSFEVLTEETHQVNWRAYKNFTRDASTNILTKTSYYYDNAIAVSTNKLSANTDGRFIYTYLGNERRFTLGLCNVDTITGSANVLHKLGMSTSSIAYMPRTIGDTIIIERKDSTMYYRFHKANGVQHLLWTKPCDPTEELYVYVNCFDPGATINDFTCSFSDGISIKKNKLLYQNTTNNTLGSIDVEITGVAPISYSWSNGATTQDISNLTAGTYTLTATDAIGETKTKSFKILSEESHQVNWKEYENFILDPVTNILRKTTYYDWNTIAISTNKLPANTNGRFAYTYLGNEKRFMLGLCDVDTITPYGNVSHKLSMSTTSIAYMSRAIGDSIIIERIDSTMYYRFHKANGSQHLLYTKPCDPAEELSVYVCCFDPSATINNFTCSFSEGLSITSNAIFNHNTKNNKLGSIDVEITGKAPISYSWSNGATTEDISALEAGVYTLVVTDGNGDTKSESFEVETEIYYQVSWQNIQNYTLDPATNILTSSGTAQWSSGALSKNKLPAYTDGKIIYPIKGDDYFSAIGFAEYNDIATYTSMLHYRSFYYAGLQGYFAGPLTSGDILEIERKGSEIIYRLKDANNKEIMVYKLATDPSKELYVDVSSRYANRPINNVYCTFGIENEKCGPSITLSQDFICPGTYTELMVNTLPNNDYDDYLFVWTPSNTISTTSTPLTFVANPTVTTDYVLQYHFYNESDEIICSGKIPQKIVVENKGCNEEVKDEEQEILGCCFGNFGAGVYVGNQTNLNVYCNVLNELGSESTGNIVKGEFLNKGGVNVELDWIHNAQNELYVSDEGNTVLIGEDQQLRGNSSTHFYNLELEGTGTTKEILIDEYIKNVLQLNDNELAAIDDIVFVENTDEAAVLRGSGYVSSDGTGALNRALSNSAQVYLFPMGSQQGTYRYRPVVVNNPINQKFQVNFQNTSIPSNIDVSQKAPNVQSLNTDYYYKLNSDQSNTNLELTLYYPTIEGPYQSIAQWKTPIAGNQWEMSPNPNATNIPSISANTQGLLSASTTGIQNYVTENFTLSRAGFYVNTGDLNGGDDESLVITVSNANDNNGNGINDDQEGGASGTDTNNDGIDDAFQGGTDTDGDGIDDAFDSTPNGGSSSGGGLNDPNYSTDDDQTFAPSPVAGTYNMDISSNDDCIDEGTILFTVDNNGNIVNESDVKFIPSNSTQEYYLSNSVFETDNVASGLILNATPEDVLEECANNLQIKMGPNEPFILNISSSSLVIEDIEIISPLSSLLTNAEFRIYKSGTLEFSQQLSGNNIISASSVIPGALTSWIEGTYSFELEITFNGATEIIKGQFIIKE